MHLKIPTVRDSSVSIPTQSTEHAAGYDLCARLDKPFVLEPMRRQLFATGLRMAIPPGCVGMICPRSGLALKHGVTVLNAPGVIDADYRGDVGVILMNLGEQPFTVRPGDRIAQIVLQPALRAVFVPALGLAPTDRGDGGFGSTGLAAGSASVGQADALVTWQD
jgi:dUTP pyrophosphatase